MSPAAVLSARLGEASPLLCPGIYDAFTAALAEQAGSEALYLSGASIAYTQLGAPDIGLVSMSEVADTVARIRERVSLPVIVDADTGFGNALNVQRTVRVLERAGASALQLEDQSFPKRCGHLQGKALVPATEMVGKLHAALDTRESALIVARTDAIAVEGFDAAVTRAEAYLAAGADVLFVEAPETLEQLRALGEQFRGRVPLLANMVEGGQTPVLTSPELGALGFKLLLYPGGAARAMAHALQAYYASLLTHGTTAPFRGRMFDFAELNNLLGTQAILREGEKYAGSVSS